MPRPDAPTPLSSITDAEIREWTRLRSLPSPGPETLRTVYRVALPALLDEVVRQREAVHTLRRECAYYKELLDNANTLLVSAADAATRLDHQLAELAAQLPVEFEEESSGALMQARCQVCGVRQGAAVVSSSFAGTSFRLCHVCLGLDLEPYEFMCIVVADVGGWEHAADHLRGYPALALAAGLWWIHGP
jgi:hypothetical protein